MHKLVSTIFFNKQIQNIIYIYNKFLRFFKSIGQCNYKYTAIFFLLCWVMYFNPTAFAMNGQDKPNPSKKSIKKSQQESSSSSDEEELKRPAGGIKDIPFVRPKSWFDKIRDRDLANFLQSLDMSGEVEEEELKKREKEAVREALLEQEERKRDQLRVEAKEAEKRMEEEHREREQQRQLRVARARWVDGHNSRNEAALSGEKMSPTQAFMEERKQDEEFNKRLSEVNRACKSMHDRRVRNIKYVLQEPIRQHKDEYPKVSKQLQEKEEELKAYDAELEKMYGSSVKTLQKKVSEIQKVVGKLDRETLCLLQQLEDRGVIIQQKTELQSRLSIMRIDVSPNDFKMALIDSASLRPSESHRPFTLYTKKNAQNWVQEKARERNIQEAAEIERNCRLVLEQRGHVEKEEKDNDDIWLDVSKLPLGDVEFSDVDIDDSEDESESENQSIIRDRVTQIDNRCFTSIHHHPTPLRSDNPYLLLNDHSYSTTEQEEEEEEVTTTTTINTTITSEEEGSHSSPDDVLSQSGEGPFQSVASGQEQEVTHQGSLGEGSSQGDSQQQQQQAPGQQAQTSQPGGTQAEGGDSRDYSTEGARPKLRGKDASSGGPGGKATFIPGYSLEGHISSLYGMQTILLDASEQVAFTLKGLALKAQNNAMVKDDALQLNDNCSSVKRKKQIGMRVLQQDNAFQELMPYRVIGFTDTKHTNLECKLGSSQVGLLVSPKDGLSVGLAYNRYKDTGKEHQGISLGGGSGSAKSKVELDGLSMLVAWNPRGQGFTGHVVGYYGWGELKSERSFTHDGEQVTSKGTPGISLSGGLIQLGYTIPVTKQVSFTPYVECMVSNVTWNGYRETTEPLPCEVSSNKEKVFEKSIGLRNRWDVSERSCIQSWVAGVSSYRSTDKVHAKPLIAAYGSKYEASIPSHGRQSTKAELGMSYKSKVTRNVEIGLQGKAQLDKSNKRPQHQVNVHFQYMF